MAATTAEEVWWCDKPIDESTARGVNSLTSDEIQELQGYEHPPMLVRRTLEAVYLILDAWRHRWPISAPHWAKVHQMLDKDLSHQLLAYDAETLRAFPKLSRHLAVEYFGAGSGETAQALNEQGPDVLTYRRVARSNEAAAVLLKWCKLQLQRVGALPHEEARLTERKTDAIADDRVKLHHLTELCIDGEDEPLLEGRAWRVEVRNRWVPVPKLVNQLLTEAASEGKRVTWVMEGESYEGDLAMRTQRHLRSGRAWPVRPPDMVDPLCMLQGAWSASKMFQKSCLVLVQGNSVTVGLKDCEEVGYLLRRANTEESLERDSKGIFRWTHNGCEWRAARITPLTVTWLPANGAAERIRGGAVASWTPVKYP